MLLGAGSCWALSGPNEHARGEAHRIAKGDGSGFGVSLPMCLRDDRGEGQSLVAHSGKDQLGGTVDEAGDPLNAVGGQSSAQRLDDRYVAGDGGFKDQNHAFLGRSKNLVAVRGEQGFERNGVAIKVSDRRGGDNQLKNRPKAPEIDAGAGGGALALLVGGLLLAAEKRRRSL
jgi:hypothetical protein